MSTNGNDHGGSPYSLDGFTPQERAALVELRWKVLDKRTSDWTRPRAPHDLMALGAWGEEYRQDVADLAERTGNTYAAEEWLPWWGVGPWLRWLEHELGMWQGEGTGDDLAA